MTALRHQVIGAGLTVLRATGLHRVAAPLTQGLGAILTFHRVRPWSGDRFAPNRLLEITPDFLDRLLSHLKRTGYLIVPLDDVPERLRHSRAPRFVALTFDDGYRDTLSEALPVLERHDAPFTVFATTGFLNRSARLWWVELEAALRLLPRAILRIGGRRLEFTTGRPDEKEAAFKAMRQALLGEDDTTLLAVTADLCMEAGVSPLGLVDDLCMDWSELAGLAAHRLATVGCHTVSHPRLARASATQLDVELRGSRSELELRLGQPVRHFCYPYGMASAAGRREYAAAAEQGFSTAVTTRPGVLFPGHAEDLTALPRLSVNGLWQTTGAVEVLLSGLGPAIWNRGRRVARP